MGLFSKLKRKPEQIQKDYFDILNELFRSRKYSEALRVAREASGSGDPVGWNFEAMLYDFGLGVDRDFDRASALYRKSADAGHPIGQYEYGKRIYNQEVDGSEYDALRYLSASAKVEYPPAMFLLGMMYFGNKAGLNDDEAAFRLFKNALEGGEDMAEPFLGYCLCYGLGTQQDSKQGTMHLMHAALHDSEVAEGMLEEIMPGVDWRAGYEKELQALNQR